MIGLLTLLAVALWTGCGGSSGGTDPSAQQTQTCSGAGQTCTPGGVKDPCKTYTTTCGGSGTSSTC